MSRATTWIVENEQGKCVDGLFFELEAYPVANRWATYTHALIVDRVQQGHLRIEVRERSVTESNLRGCPFHPEYYDSRRLDSLTVELFGGAGSGDWIGGLGGEVCVSPRVRCSLERHDFIGLRFLDVDVCYQSAGTPKQEYYAVCFDGADAWRPYTCLPISGNRCAKCGHGPIVCDACRDFSFCCELCKAKVVSYEGEYPLRFGIDDGRGPVVSLELWDGTDFWGGSRCVASGRVVDALIELNLDVFCARSLRSFVGERKWQDYAHLASKHFGRR